MTVPTRFESLPTWLPYALGLFMLIPYALWFGMWLFAFPGDKNGFESVGPVLFLVSAPLVVWFGLCSLGFIANSMAGSSEFRSPSGWAVADILAVLPAAALWLGAAGAFYLFTQDRPLIAIAAPVVVGALIAGAIHAGEASRQGDRTAAASVRRSPEPDATGGNDATPSSAAQRTTLWMVMAALALLLAALVLSPG